MIDAFAKWRSGLAKTSKTAFGQLATLFGATDITQETWDDLEALLAHATQPTPDFSSPQQPPPGISQLTDRQIDVLRHLCTGLSNKEISARLGIAEKTVKVHIAAIFKTLNVVNRTQAAKFLHDSKEATAAPPGA